MRVALLFVLVLCVATLAPGLSAVGPVDVREARDLEVARELVLAREPLTPLFGHEPLFEKPIVAYAPDAIVTLLWPRHLLLISRLWRALAAALLVALVGSLGARRLGGRAGVFSAAVLATSLGTVIAAQADGTQLLATLLAWTAVHGFTEVWFGRTRGRDAGLVLAYGALAAALVIAGPLAALWPLAAAALFVALARPRDGGAALRPWLGAAVMLGIALPWYGADLERNGWALGSRIPMFPYAADARGAWFLGPFLALSFVAVAFFPWSALLPGAFRHAAMWWRRLPQREDVAGIGADLGPLARELSEERAAHWFVVCALAALLPMIFYPRPPLTAVLPALPALALLCGRLLDHVAEDPERVMAPLVRATQLLALIGTMAALLLVMLGARIVSAGQPLRLLATLAFVTSWLPFLAAFTRRLRLAALLMTLPLVIGAPVAAWRALPGLEDDLDTRSAARVLNRAAPAKAPVLLFEDAPASFRLLAPHNVVQAAWLGTSWERARAADGAIYLAFRPAREREVARSAGAPLEILARTPTLVVARTH